MHTVFDVLAEPNRREILEMLARRERSVGELETELARAGIQKHDGKDEDDNLNCRCVGVDLVDGRWWWPPPLRMWQIALAVLHLDAVCKS